MADVFISYSRKDTDFVRRLHAALNERGRETWVDWEGIPPSAEWMSEIVAAIDAATAFVFIMTPDSLASTICIRELAHAAEQNKRLIPIVCRDCEAAAVPEALAKMNWLFFRDSDDFPAALQMLVTAVDTDLDWVRAHTRLLLRAREWDTRGRESSLALHGKDLRAAEQWLTLGPTKQPQPTELQTSYVLQSRKVATNRRYMLLGAAAVGLVAVAILGTTTYFGRREAARQQTIAVAGRLTADAELARAQPESVPADMGWMERSVLLATEAARQLDSLGLRSLQTDLALRRGLALLPRRVAKSKRVYDRTRVDALVTTADGQMMTVTESPLRVERFGAGGELLGHKDAPGGVQSVKFSFDGKFIATTEFNHVAGLIDIWETATLQRMASFPGLGDTVRAFSLSPGAEYLAASTENFDETRNEWIPGGTTRLWKVASTGYRELAPLPHASHLMFSPDGMWLAAIVDSVPRVWKMKDGPGRNLEEVPLTVTHPDASSLLFSSDGTQLVVGFGSSEATAWAVGDWKSSRELQSEGDSIPWAVGPDARYVAVRDDGDYTARIFDTEQGEEVARVHATDLIGAIAFRPDSHEVVVGGLGDSIESWQIDLGGSDIVRIPAAGIRGAIFSPDETALLTIDAAAEQRSVRSWPLRDRRGSSQRAELPGGLTVFSADGRFIAVASDSAATVLDSADGKAVVTLRYPGKATAIAVSPEGASVAIATDGGVFLWHTGTSQEPMRFTVRGKVAQRNLAVGPSGTTLAAVAEESATRRGTPLTVYFWQPHTAAEVARYAVGTNRSGLIALPCALSADARYFTTNEGLGVMSVRETRSGRVIASVNHPGDHNDCAFSADARLLVTYGSDTARVWEVAAQAEIARIEHIANVRDLVFSPRRRYLATIGPHISRVWLLEPADLIDAACARLTRNLTADERRDYFGDQPYQPTCPALGAGKPAAVR